MANAQKGFAILGAGIFAKEAYLPALATLASSPPLVAVYSRSEKSASELAGITKSSPDVYFDVSSTGEQIAGKGLDELLKREDIASVLVVLPITTQPGIIIKSLKAGKHVLSEKPVAPTVAAARDLIATYNKEYKPKGLTWRVAENWEAEPGFIKAGQVLAEGKIGDICWWKATVVNYVDETSKWYQTPWRTVPEYQGGFLLDGGVHTTAALRTFLPPAARPTHLSAHAALRKKILAPHDTILVIARSGGSSETVYSPTNTEPTKEVHGILEMTFANPFPSSSAATPPLSANGLTIIGTKGTLSISMSSGALRLVLSLPDGKEEIWEEKTRGVEEELEAFFTKIGGGGGLDIGAPEKAVWDVGFIEASLNSAGKEVALPPLPS